MEKGTIKGKRIECIIGIVLLIPPLLGAIAFTLNLLGMNHKFAGMYELSTEWTGGYHDTGGYTSAAPIYLGLMAIAGAYLIKDGFKYFYIKGSK